MTFQDFINSRKMYNKHLVEAYEIVSDLFEQIPKDELMYVRNEGYNRVSFKVTLEIVKSYKVQIIFIGEGLDPYALREVIVEDFTDCIESVEVNFDKEIVEFTKKNSITFVMDRSDEGLIKVEDNLISVSLSHFDSTN